MSKSSSKAIFIGLGVCIVGVGLLKILPASTSLGQGNKVSNDVALQPGRLYHVYCDTATTVPSGMKVCSFSSFGTSFEHDGTRKDKDEPCHGPIKMVLRDDGRIEHRCIWCKRIWVRDADGKLIKGSNES